MNDMKQTGIFVATAVVLAIIAVLAVPSRKAPAVFDDQGTLFYEEFKPGTCTSIEVISFDEKTNDTRYFCVTRDAKAGWIIPSHENYRADAEKPIVAAATIVNGLKKGTLRATRSEDHAALGVIDPKANTSVNADKAGTRLVLKAGGEVRCDLIIGKEIEGKWGFRNVRRADSKRVYACKIDARDISTRFANWVETDVLQLASANIKQLRLDAYTVRETDTAVTVVPGEIITMAMDDKSNWTMAGLAETEELNTSKPSEMRSILNDLTLVGVRRKHPELIKLLRKSNSVELTQAERGFVGRRSPQRPRTKNPPSPRGKPRPAPSIASCGSPSSTMRPSSVWSRSHPSSPPRCPRLPRSRRSRTNRRPTMTMRRTSRRRISRRNTTMR